jgi:colanic acid/amylovoran biosynthesis glycosyltransferase
MKVAFIVEQFPSLSETFILNQITGLLDRGHEVDIYAEYPANSSKVHPDVGKYNLLERTYYAVYTSIPTNRFLRVLKTLGLLFTNSHKSPVFLLRAVNVSSYRKEAGSALNLLCLLIPLLPKRPSYDIIHCHFGMNGRKGAVLRESGAIQGKLIVSYYGMDISYYIEAFGDDIYKPLLDKGDLFFSISEVMKRQLIELGCDEKKIILHRIGMDCRRFLFSSRRLNADGQVRLVTIARLVEKKGVEYAIRAVAKLANVNQNIEYNIIGDGPLREDLQRLIQELDVCDMVKLLGWKQQKEIVEILDNSHILLAPSVTGKNGDQEGTPVAIMEAMAMGLPVLSTQHSGIPELIKNGVSGFLVPERDVDALAEKLNDLIKHPEVWPQMGRSGRLHVEEHHDINKLNDQLVEIYQQLRLSRT